MPIKVLMIDDEKKICQVIKKGLELIGDFKVDCCHSGKEGIKKAKHDKPDIILLDLCMPKMDGMTVLKTLKGSYPSLEIPVIVISALIDNDTKRTCAHEYGEEYIEKPVNIENLKNQIEAALRRLGR